MRLLLRRCAPAAAVLVLTLAACSWAHDSTGHADTAALTATAPAAVAEVPAAVPAQANPWMDPARQVLIKSCGGCHEPDSPNAKPRALAIFDLREPVWHQRMDEHQLQSLAGRVRGSGSIAGTDKQQVLAFVRCELEGDCSATG